MCGELVSIGKALTGKCNTFPSIVQTDCPNENIPTTIAAFLMISPIFISAIYSSKFGLTLVIWITSIISMSITVIVGGFVNSIFVVVVYSFASFLILTKIRRNYLSNFYKSEQFKDLLAENERLADESFANELRHMIGNVAHDLKTVIYYNFSNLLNLKLFIYLFVFYSKAIVRIFKRNRFDLDDCTGH
jgi:hypothetical protein